MELVVAPRRRGWMDAIPDHFAYRCLPLAVGNQAGWQILSAGRVEASWDGGPHRSSLTVAGAAASHFGHGVLTFQPGYVFRTSAGTQLLIMGPANHMKDGIQPLVAVVESDWNVATWTMNWRFTRPGTVAFGRDEPICQILPIQLDRLEATIPHIRSLDGPLADQYAAWSASRNTFNGSARSAKEWEGDYTRGSSPGGTGAATGQHRTKLRLKEFTPLGP